MKLPVICLLFPEVASEWLPSVVWGVKKWWLHQGLWSKGTLEVHSVLDIGKDWRGSEAGLQLVLGGWRRMSGGPNCVGCLGYSAVQDHWLPLLQLCSLTSGVRESWCVRLCSLGEYTFQWRCCTWTGQTVLSSLNYLGCFCEVLLPC